LPADCRVRLEEPIDGVHGCDITRVKKNLTQTTNESTFAKLTAQQAAGERRFTQIENEEIYGREKDSRRPAAAELGRASCKERKKDVEIRWVRVVKVDLSGRSGLSGWSDGVME
jgi:hypothetical protein